MFSRFCFFIPAVFGVLFLLPLRAAEIRPEAVGSPGWIERYCDRSGGCLTLLNVQPTKPDGTVPGMKCPKCRAARGTPLAAGNAGGVAVPQMRCRGYGGKFPFVPESRA